MEAKNISLNIGGYELHPILTGQFGLDGGSMFGTVPKVLWEKTNPPDDKNRIKMEARNLLLRGHGKNILVDTGNGSDFIEKYGEKLGGKFASMFAIEAGGPSLLKSLSQYGLKPEDITDVILTHLHFDHAGGGTCFRNGKIVPTFPNAKYYVQRENLETAQEPNLRERASYFKANFEPLVEAGVLKALEGPINSLLPHIDILLSHGHTRGQQILRISDEKTGLFFAADLVPTSTHIRLPWVMGYDLDPLKIIEEKSRVLKEAFEKNWYLFFEHDPYCELAQVSFEKGDYTIKDKFRLS